MRPRAFVTSRLVRRAAHHSATGPRPLAKCATLNVINPGFGGATLNVTLLELPLVVTGPELSSRPGLVMPDADGFEALHPAEEIQAPGDILGGQPDILQIHPSERRQVGHRGRSAVQ